MKRSLLLALMISTLGATVLPGAASARPSDSVAAPRTDAEVHVVGPGDTLWAIGRRHGISPDELSRANRLSNPNRLRIGDRLVLTRPRGEQDLEVPAAPGRRRRPAFDWPSRGVVTSQFGYRGKRHHHGIDIAAPVGTPIRASRDGVVRFTGWQGGYGRLVILDHGDGLSTWYGHASRILVTERQTVSKGTVIALVGTSGHVTGPNLHFEVRRGNTPLDPWLFVNRSER